MPRSTLPALTSSKMSGGPLEDDLGRADGQPAHAGAVLPRVAAVDADAAVAEEAQDVLFPALRRQRQPQALIGALLDGRVADRPRGTERSVRERMSRRTTVLVEAFALADDDHRRESSRSA